MAVEITSASPMSDALVVLTAAGLVIPAFASLRISPVVGFILIGMLVGPHGLGGLTDAYPWLDWVTISNGSTIDLFGEIGIVLLMFAIGLELSFERLRVMRRLVFGLGSAQVAVTAAALGAALAVGFGQPPLAALTVGAALALSSTAIVLPILSSENALVAGAGRASFAVLLLQDLMLIPLLFALSLASGDGTFVAADVTPMVVKGALAIGVLVLAGRFLVRPALRRAARTRSPEMFMAATLILVIGASAVTAGAGLSLVIGALIAGLIVADTEYRKQVEVTVEPFKGLLLGVFLISIGMKLDLERLAADPLPFALAAAGLVALKAALVLPLLRLAVGPHPGLTRAALLLGPGGEMSLIVLTAAMAAGVVARDAGEAAQLVTALAMTALPLLSRVGQIVERRLHAAQPQEAPPPLEDKGRVLIVGFGRVGQMVAQMLERHGVAYLAVDNDPDAIAAHRQDGRPVLFGDATRVELLRHLDAGRARALVITTDAPRASEHLVAAAREEWPDLHIIARSRDAAHAARLYRLGASDAVPETVEASLQLSEAVLVDIGVPMGPVIASIHEKRAELRESILTLAPELVVAPKMGRRRLRDAGPA